MPTRHPRPVYLVAKPSILIAPDDVKDTTVVVDDGFDSVGLAVINTDAVLMPELPD